MLAVLALLFIVVPIVELVVIIQVGQAIGVVPTIALLIVMGLGGSWLMKREGIGVYRRIEAQLAAGRMPGRDLVDGFLILFGGALMLTPGFVSDFLGISLLLPPVRAVVRRVLAKRFRDRILVTATTATTTSRVHDARSWDDPGDRRELGP